MFCVEFGEDRIFLSRCLIECCFCKTWGDACGENADLTGRLNDLLPAKDLTSREAIFESAFALETVASALIPTAAAKNNPFGGLSGLLFKLDS